jgi:hypothetical protein
VDVINFIYFYKYNMDTFKVNVSKYIDYENQIKNENNRLNIIKNKKKILEKYILEFILTNNLPHKIKINNQFITIKENKIKSQLNKKFLINSLNNYFNENTNHNNTYCNQIANDIYTYIDNSRLYNTKFSLKKLK